MISCSDPALDGSCSVMSNATSLPADNFSSPAPVIFWPAASRVSAMCADVTPAMADCISPPRPAASVGCPPGTLPPVDVADVPDPLEAVPPPAAPELPVDPLPEVDEEQAASSIAEGRAIKVQ